MQGQDVTPELPDACCQGTLSECIDYGCQRQVVVNQQPVFVYGTLKRNHANHRIIAQDESAKCVFYDAFIKGEMFDLGQYPAVVLSGKGVVFGELWYVDSATLHRMDKLEGHPDYYKRVLVPLLGAEKNTQGYVAWVYVMQKEQFREELKPMFVANWMKT